MKLTIDIDITNNKALALINYIRTLDFISINEKIDTPEYALTSEQIEILEERKQKHINGQSKSYNWNDIKKELRSSSK